MVADLMRQRIGLIVAVCAVVLATRSFAAPADDLPRLKQIQAMPIDDAATKAALERDQLTNPPYYLYELARRTLAGNEAAAEEWFVVALARVQYDGMRCTDPTASNGLGMLGQIAPDVAHRLQDKAALQRAARAALARKDLFASKASPFWACLHGMNAVMAGMDGKPFSPAEAVMAEAKWPAVQAAIRKQLTELAQ